MAEQYVEIFRADGALQMASDRRMALLVNSIDFFFPAGSGLLYITVPGLVPDGTWLSLMLPSSFQAYGIDMLQTTNQITLQRGFGGNLSGTLLIYRI